MTTAEIDAELSELAVIADGRRAEAWAKGSCVAAARGGAGMDYLTQDEIGRMHELKLALPSYADEAIAAKERIAKRLHAHRLAKGIVAQPAADSVEMAGP